MVTYRSTCRSCGDELIVTQSGQETHPSCPDSPLEELQTRFIDAVNAENDEEIARLERSLDSLGNIRPKLLASALAYASHGWPVFPLHRGTKAPATRHSFKDAVTDPDQIRAWWRRDPHYNIGLATGHVFDVVDVDAPKGTLPWIELRDSGAIGDIHGSAVTPRGGMHFYIPATGGGNLTGFRPGIDYRGIGGLIVAPPSTRPDGRYSWSMLPSPTLTRSAAATTPDEAA